MSQQQYDEYGVLIRPRPSQQQVQTVDDYGVPIKKKVGGGTSSTTSDIVATQSASPSSPPSGLQENGNVSIFHTKENFMSSLTEPPKTVTTFDGTQLAISPDDKSPYANSLHQSAEALNGLQQRVLSKTPTPLDLEVLSQGSGKSVAATQAYITKGKDIGAATDINDNTQNTAQQLKNNISSLSKNIGGTVNPDDVINNPDEGSSFLSKINSAVEATKGMSGYLQGIIPFVKSAANVAENLLAPTIDKNKLATSINQASIDSGTKVADQQKALVVQAQKTIPVLVQNITDNTAKEVVDNGMDDSQAADLLYKRLDPLGYEKSAEMRSQQPESTGTKIGTSLINGIAAIKNFSDWVTNTGENNKELLNAEKGQYELLLNRGMANYVAQLKAKGISEGDQQSIDKANTLIPKIKDENDIVEKYPMLMKQQMADYINQRYAQETGIVNGTETQGINGELLKLGGVNTDVAKRYLQEGGFYDKPNFKDYADDVAEHPATYLATGNTVAGAPMQFLNVFKSIFNSVADLEGVRTATDRHAENIQSQLFPSELTQNIKPDVSFDLAGHHFETTIAKTVNGIAHLGGYIAASALGGEIGGAAGLSTNAAQRAAAWGSFGADAIDSGLKTADQLGLTPAQSWLYAGMNAVMMSEGGRLLEFGKGAPIPQIPGVNQKIADAATGLINKSLTDDAAKELVDGAVNTWGDALKKWGIGTAKGAGVMSAFGVGDKMLHVAAGDPNANLNDILPEAANSYFDGLLTMGIIGGFGLPSDIAKSKNSTYKAALSSLVDNHDVAQDILKIGLDKGLFSQQEYDQKLATLNTGLKAKSTLNGAIAKTGVKLDGNQRQTWIANATAEQVLRNQAEQEGTSEAEATQYTKQADALKGQNEKIFNGLKFSTLLEPQYNLYDAQQALNEAQKVYAETPTPENEQSVIDKKAVFDKFNENYLNGIPESKINEATQTENAIPVSTEKTGATNEGVDNVSKEAEAGTFEDKVRALYPALKNTDDAGVNDFVKENATDSPSKFIKEFGEDKFNEVVSDIPIPDLKSKLKIVKQYTPNSEDVNILDKAISAKEDEAIYGKKGEPRIKLDFTESKPIVEPPKPISEMNSEEIGNYATEVRQALRQHEKEFEGKTEAEKESGGYYDYIDNVAELRDIEQRVNFVENSENLDDLANSTKSVLRDFNKDNPSQESLAILNAAKKKAAEMNIEPETLIKEVIKKVGNDYKDKNDAEFMMRNYLEKVVPAENKPTISKEQTEPTTKEQPEQEVTIGRNEIKGLNNSVNNGLEQDNRQAINYLNQSLKKGSNIDFEGVSTSEGAATKVTGVTNNGGARVEKVNSNSLELNFRNKSTGNKVNQVLHFKTEEDLSKAVDFIYSKHKDKEAKQSSEPTNKVENNSKNKQTEVPKPSTSSPLPTKEEISKYSTEDRKAYRKAVANDDTKSIQDIANKYRDSKSADLSDKKAISTSDGKMSIDQYVERAKSVLNKLFPNTKLETFEKESDFEDAGGIYGSRGTYDRVENKILLNLQQIREDNSGKTAFHEVIHPIVDAVVGDSMTPLFNELVPQLKDVNGFEKVLNHIDLYDTNKIAKEGITETLTQIADGKISLDNIPEAKRNKIYDILNKIFEKLGLSIRFADEYTFKDFAADIKKAFETGDVEDRLKKEVEKGKDSNDNATKNAKKINDILFGKEAEKLNNPDLVEKLRKDGFSDEEIKDTLKEDRGLTDAEAENALGGGGKSGNGAVESEGDGSSNAITHAAIDDFRREMGLEPFSHIRMTDAEVNAKADKAIADGYDVQNLFHDIAKGHNPNEVEVVILKKTKAAIDAAVEKNPSKANLKKAADFATASDVAGQIAGRAFRLRQDIDEVDVGKQSLSDFFVTRMRNKGVTPETMTDAQKSEIQKQYKDLKDAHDKLEQKVAKLVEDDAKKKAESAVKKMKDRTSSQPKKTHDEYVKERKSLVEQLKAAKAKAEERMKGITKSGFSVTVTPEMVKIIGKIAYSHVSEGAQKLQDVSQKVFNEIKDVFEGVTQQDVVDVLAGAYNAVKPEKNDILKQMAALRSEAIKESDIAKEKKDAQRLKTIKKTYQGKIDKLKEDLKNGNYLQEKDKPEPLKLDKEALALKDQYISIKQETQRLIAKDEYIKKSSADRFWINSAEALNIMRTIMSSSDFSAVLRQAVVPTIAHPLIAVKSMGGMFRDAFSQKLFDRWLFDLKESPVYDEMVRSKVYISDPNDVRLSKKEEAFMNNFVEKVPVIGSWLVKGSERAYLSYLNRMRVELYQLGSDVMARNGKTIENSPKDFEGLGSFVNNMTGRGGVPESMELATPLISAGIFAPRLIASRLNLLGITDIPNIITRVGTAGQKGINVGFYSKLPPEIRRMAITDMAKFVMFGSAVLALTSLIGDDKKNKTVELNSRSSDFGKIKVGDTRYDIWGGMQQYVVFFSRIIAKETKSVNGKTYKLDGKGAFGQTRGDVIERFIRGKASPALGMGWDFVKGGRTIVGDKILYGNLNPFGDHKRKEITGGAYLAEHFLPMTSGDITDAIQSGDMRNLFAIPATIFGISVQTFNDKK